MGESSKGIARGACGNDRRHKPTGQEATKVAGDKETYLSINIVRMLSSDLSRYNYTNTCMYSHHKKVLLPLHANYKLV